MTISDECREVSRLSGGAVVAAPMLNSAHVNFRLNHAGIGGAEKVEGGWLATSKRKPVPTLWLAARQNIERVMNQHAREAHQLRGLLQRLPVAMVRETEGGAGAAGVQG